MSASAVGRGPDIPLFDLRMTDGDLDAVAAVLRGGSLAAGPAVARFEQTMTGRLGAEHAIAVCSGTAALHLSYLACGVGPGDEVIVPGITFVATASAAVHCGATPVFADLIGPSDWSLDPEAAIACVTPRTRAVCAVHYAGYAAPVDVLAELCTERGLSLVEDVAHAPGASLAGRTLGTWGHAAAFSFFSNKVLSAGEGGLVVVNEADRAAVVRNRAADDGSDGADGGLNYALDEPRAALLLSRLRRMDEEIEQRRALTFAYRRKLAHLDAVRIPYDDAQVASSACYVMPIGLGDPARRDAVRSAMRDEGIQTSVLYPALHELTAYRAAHGDRRLPQAEWVARADITLPLYPHLTEPDQDRVVDALERALRR